MLRDAIPIQWMDITFHLSVESYLLSYLRFIRSVERRVLSLPPVKNQDIGYSNHDSEVIFTNIH